MIPIQSKLPKLGTNIFTTMSTLAAEHNAINLSQGFPNFSSSQRLIELVKKYMDAGYNQYAPMAGVPSLREQIVRKIEKLHGLKVDVNEEITMTAGASQAVYTIISAFVEEGDEVILVEPAYDIYRPGIKLFGGIPVAYELSAPDYSIDWEAFAKLITDKTKMIIVNTPQNPCSFTFKEEDFLALQRITSGTDIVVLSDEVYEHIIFDGQIHQSALKFPELFNRSFVTYSFGKTFHNTGWKLGYCVAPEYLMQEFRKLHQYSIFTVNTPMQYAIAEFMEDENEYLSLPAFYQKKRDFFAEVMQGSKLKPIRSEGTYFQLFDYSAISNEKDTEFAKRMTIEHGVASIPVSVFYGSGKDDKVVRICFAKTEETLEKAGNLLRKI